MRSKSFRYLAVLVTICFSNLYSIAQTAQPVPIESGFDYLPLAFEPNRGQAEGGAGFLLKTGSYTVFLHPEKATFVIPAPNDQNILQPPSVVTLELLSSNRKAEVEGLGLLPGKSNYFLGARRKNWISGVPQYSQVRLKSIYPGIDLVYYGNGGELEYDFVLSPLANPEQLAFQVTGATESNIDGDGNLLIQVAGGAIRLRKPALYQDIHGERHAIAGGFVLRSNGQIGVQVGRHDRTESLIIDPVLSYSTLIGANNSTQIQGIAVDSGGNVYVTGTTFATNYPTVNAYQSVNKGSSDVFVTKLNPAGNKILYSTYLGGSGFDNAAGIAVDGSGNAYITGTVGSSDFPTTSGAFMTTCPSICNTPFLTKFETDGTLAFSTFMGGSNSPAHAIAVDSAGEAYIAGDTASNDLPTTPGSFEPVYPGEVCTSCYNGYVEKLNSSGTALVYSTYFGAIPAPGFPPSTSGASIAVDSTGSAYLVGNTTGIPVKNPIQSSVVGGPNAFVTKFSPDGSSLIFSTYLGGTSTYFFSYAGDFATGVAVDQSGNVHVVGTSSSCEFPLTLNAFSTTCATEGYTQEVFAATLNSAGSQIVFSTFLGNGFSSGIAVDGSGNSYVAGTSTYGNYPVVNAIETAQQNSPQSVSWYVSNGFISELSPSGKLLFSTYLGQTGGGSSVSGLAIDTKGAIHAVGSGQGDFPIVSPIPSQIIQNTNYTVFLAKISASKGPQFSLSPRVSPILALRNVSSSPLTINSITTSSNFTQGGNCGATLAPGTGCTLILVGADDHKTSGTVTISSNASLKPETFTITKSPNGNSVGAIVNINPVGIQFPAQLIGTTSSAQQIVIQNQGMQAAAINSIEMIQPSTFTETNNCPALLSPFASCQVTVAYTAATSDDSAQIAIIADPSQTRYTAFLAGYGSSSAILASTPSVDFGSEFVGSAPLARIVNFTNTTPYPASIRGLATSSEFAQTNTCTSPLAPQASCRAAVTFSPSTNEIPTGTLTASNLGPGGNQIVSLYGTGVILSDLSASPIPVEMGGFLGETISPGIVTLTNTSAVSMSLASFTVAEPFTQTNNCNGTLAATASCTMTVNFQPTTSGTFNGTVSIQHSGVGSPQVVPLIGTSQSIFQLNPTTVQFGQEQVGTPIIGYLGMGNYANYGNVTVSSVTVQGSDFQLSKNGCPSVFPPYTGCGDVEISFTPSRTGVRNGTVTVVASDSTTPHVATLQGTGVSAGVGTLSLTSLTFGTQQVDTQSQPQTLTLKNTGTGALTLVRIAPSTQFTETNTCGQTLAAGASCTISVVFAPTLQGILDGSVTVVDDGLGSPHSVSLNGIGQ